MPTFYRFLFLRITRSGGKAKHQKCDIEGVALLPQPAIHKQSLVRAIAVFVLLLGFAVRASADKVTIKEATAKNTTDTSAEIEIQLNRVWNDCSGSSSRNPEVSLIDLNSASLLTVPLTNPRLTGAHTTLSTSQRLDSKITYLVFLTQVGDCTRSSGVNHYGDPLHIELKVSPSDPPEAAKPHTFSIDSPSSEVSFDILRPEIDGDVGKLSAVPATQTKDKRFHEYGFKNELRFQWNAFKPAAVYGNEFLDFDSKETRNSPNPLSNAPRPATINLVNDLLKFDVGWMLHPWQSDKDQRKWNNYHMVIAGAMELQPAPVRKQFVFDDIKLPEFDVDLKRAKYAFAKVGLLWQRRTDKQLEYIEGGYRDGVTLSSVQEVDFPTATGVPIRCQLSVAFGLDACAKAGRFVITGNGTALTDSHRQRGVYLDMVWQPGLLNKLLQLGNWRKLKLKLENHGAYYFTHRDVDSATDTRLSDTFTPSFSIPLFGGFKLEPSVEFFWFENKIAEDSFHRTRYKLKLNYTFGCKSGEGCTW